MHLVLLVLLAASADRALTVDDYFRIQDVSEPSLSPEGDWVAYTVTSPDLEKDESESRIWMVPAAQGDRRRPISMTAPGSSASSPKFSPDGRYLAFLSDREGSDETQVWTLNRHGGDAVQLTHVEQGVTAFEWSPDGKRLVLVLKDPEPSDDPTDEPDDEKVDEDEETPKPWVIDRLQFKRDYVGYLDRRRTHLYVLHVDGEEREPTQITSGDFDDTAPAWSPDGTRIAFVSNRTENPDANYNTDIWVVSAAGSEPVRIPASASEDSSPAWSPDAARIAFRTTDPGAGEYTTYDLAVADASGGGDVEILTESLDRNVWSPEFSPDGRHIYFMVEDEGHQPLARIPSGGGEVERVDLDNVAAFEIGKEGTLVTLETTPHLPTEIFVNGMQRSFTNESLFDELALGEVEEVAFQSKDGTSIEAFIVKPPNFERGRRYPTVLWIHGGPVSQYDSRFDFEAQVFAANGYVVVMPNPRGSSGYGQSFAKAIWQGWGERDFEDVMAAVDHAIELGYADPDKLGVGGWSYGGMLTNHVITKTGRFEAAITGASATLYVSNFGHDQYQRWWLSELGPPWEPESRELWERLSPFNDVENVTTPTLIVGGEKDWNVPILNSEQLYQALKSLGKTAQLVVYPGEHHGIETPSYIKDLYERYLAWFARYLKLETPTEG